MSSISKNDISISFKNNFAFTSFSFFFLVLINLFLFNPNGQTQAETIPSTFISLSAAKQQSCKPVQLKKKDVKNCVLMQWNPENSREFSLGIYQPSESGDLKLEETIKMESWYQSATVQFPKLFKDGTQGIQISIEGNRGTGIANTLFILIAWNRDHYEVAWLDDEEDRLAEFGNYRNFSAQHFFIPGNLNDLELRYHYKEKQGDRSGKTITKTQLDWKERFRWNPHFFSYLPLPCVRSHLSPEAKEYVKKLDEKRIRFLQHKPSLRDLGADRFMEYLESLN